jgi:hypothetical protein
VLYKCTIQEEHRIGSDDKIKTKNTTLSGQFQNPIEPL